MYLSLKMVSTVVNIKITFSFQPITADDTLHQIKRSDIKRSAKESDIYLKNL